MLAHKNNLVFLAVKSGDYLVFGIVLIEGTCPLKLGEVDNLSDAPIERYRLGICNVVGIVCNESNRYGVVTALNCRGIAVKIYGYACGYARELNVKSLAGVLKKIVFNSYL